MKLTLDIFKALSKFVGSAAKVDISRIKFESGKAIATNGVMAVIVSNLEPMEIVTDESDDYIDGNSEFELETMNTDKLKGIDPRNVLGELATLSNATEEQFLMELQEAKREACDKVPDIEKLVPVGGGTKVRLNVDCLAAIASLLQSCECESVDLVINENKPVVFASKDQSVKGLLMPMIVRESIMIDGN